MVLTVGENPQLLYYMPLPGLLECPHVMTADSPRTRYPKGSKVEALTSFITWTLQSHMIFSISYWSFRSPLFNVSGGYTGPYISGEKDNWGSSWKLATTRDNFEKVSQNKNFT